MAVSVLLAPGQIVRWHGRRFVVVGCTGLHSIIAREVGKRRLDHIPVNEVQPDDPIRDKGASSQTNLISVPEKEWQAASKRFTILKPLFEMDGAERTRAHVEKVAKILKRHPATIYRWIDAYHRSGRVSAFLQNGRSDQGKSRLSNEVDAIIVLAIM
jgi:putative transposase